MEPVKDKAWLKNRAKFKSGFCNEYGKQGQHEGQKPLTWNGKPMKTCEDYESCPCRCHYDIDELFSMTGRERVLVKNVDYKPDRGDFVMPVFGYDPSDDPALRLHEPMTTPNGENVPTPSPVPAIAPLAARRTDTGRAARGGLEAQVWEALQQATDNSGELVITPKLVAEWIASKYAIPTPSSGAISAVWDRWEKMEFATQAKKPVRFTGFTGDSSWEHLQRLKSSARTAKRSAKVEASRNFSRR